jgi:uncharacterized protein (UPF0264 family)
MNLLVSVRSPDEAEAALAGGAALIDVKEPAHGSLGCAGTEAIAAVVQRVAGRRPVSAALGELGEVSADVAVPGLAYVKWGLAGWGERSDWRQALGRAAAEVACRPVAVAYADWQRAGAPSPREVCAFACARGWGAFLVDTCHKDGRTLLDWLTIAELSGLIAECRTAGVPVALAGSLGPAQMAQLRGLRPDWFAVRGAACRGERRTGAIDATAVRQIVDQLARPVTATTRAG